jgi:glycosyltransferase involved in cell wall biosynthesis
MTPVSREPPLVSIVVPARDAGAYLEEALRSIVGQRYRPIEVIVMDDASTDATAAVAASFGPPVIVHSQGEPKGIYDNANDGIMKARGEYIGVFHADDVYLPDMVTREVEYLEANPAVSAVFASDIFIDAQGTERGRLQLPDDVPPETPLPYAWVLTTLMEHKNRFLRCPGAMVRKAAYDDVGLYRQDLFRNSADLEMWLRLARRDAIAVLGDHLFKYRFGHGSSSGRYHQLRVAPENFFTILDRELEHGGHELATPEALGAYEAHRAEDLLMIAASQYIGEDRAAARATLATVNARALVGSHRVRRIRLLSLLALLEVLVRLPWNRRVADMFYRRWHEPRTPRPDVDAATAR